MFKIIKTSTYNEMKLKHSLLSNLHETMYNKLCNDIKDLVKTKERLQQYSKLRDEEVIELRKEVEDYKETINKILFNKDKKCKHSGNKKSE
jgi:hypothetical protein